MKLLSYGLQTVAILMWISMIPFAAAAEQPDNEDAVSAVDSVPVAKLEGVTEPHLAGNDSPEVMPARHHRHEVPPAWEVVELIALVLLAACVVGEFLGRLTDILWRGVTRRRVSLCLFVMVIGIILMTIALTVDSVIGFLVGKTTFDIGHLLRGGLEAWNWVFRAFKTVWRNR